ncbi:MAG: hypothetical protein GPJ54_06880 [Candidatus Heimdallarchaeota archaeon]|nr:hypothetical protein [Candidatus Heimdallarchaeota archaeon]
MIFHVPQTLSSVATTSYEANNVFDLFDKSVLLSSSPSFDGSKNEINKDVLP